MAGAGIGVSESDVCIAAIGYGADDPYAAGAPYAAGEPYAPAIPSGMGIASSPGMASDNGIALGAGIASGMAGTPDAALMPPAGVDAVDRAPGTGVARRRGSIVTVPVVTVPVVTVSDVMDRWEPRLAAGPDGAGAIGMTSPVEERKGWFSSPIANSSLEAARSRDADSRSSRMSIEPSPSEKLPASSYSVQSMKPSS